MVTVFIDLLLWEVLLGALGLSVHTKFLEVTGLVETFFNLCV